MPDLSLATPDTGAEVQPRPRVVLCGDPRTAEYELVARELSSVVSDEATSHVADLPALRQWLGEQDFPDLIVFVQTWSDEFHFAEFLTLPGVGPFSRIICCYGPWCISDGRSRQDFPLAVRVPVEDFRLVLQQECDPLAAPLPWTAGRDEIFGYRHLTRVGRVSKPVRNACSNLIHEVRTAAGTRWCAKPDESGYYKRGSDGPGDPSCLNRHPDIRVHSPDRELTQLWQDVLRLAGFSIVNEFADGQTVLWDVDVWSDSITSQWRELRQQFPQIQIVAVTGFAGPDAIAAIQASGAVAVLSKLDGFSTLRRS